MQQCEKPSVYFQILVLMISGDVVRDIKLGTLQTYGYPEYSDPPSTPVLGTSKTRGFQVKPEAITGFSSLGFARRISYPGFDHQGYTSTVNDFLFMKVFRPHIPQARAG